MKQALTISTAGHLSLAILLTLGSLLYKKNAVSSYPTIYRINLVSLPQPAALETSASTLSEPDQARVRPEPSDKPKPTQAKPRREEAVPGLPKGMKVVSVDGMSAEGSYYLGLILSKISQHWRNPYQGQDQVMRAQVYFRLNSGGELLDVQMEKPSGDGPFDQAALRVIYLAKPFPPFPPEMKLSTLGVHFEFEYIK